MDLASNCRAAVVGLAVFGCGRVANHTHQDPDGHPPRVDNDGGAIEDENAFVTAINGANVDKVDVLVMLENSRSMADKQVVLKDTVPDLVQRLVSPTCMYDGVPNRRVTPADPNASCPSGGIREINGIRSIHVGIITSSLGGSGTACHGTDGAGVEAEQADDHGHLVGTRPRFLAALNAALEARAPNAAGFLEFDTDEDGPVTSLTVSVQAMTVAAGEYGCDIASPLESVYRFLVDPAPPLTNAPGGGIDEELLAERRAFLRADSLLVVVLIADGNDHSMAANGVGLYPTERYVNAFSKAQLCTSRPDLDANSKDCPDLDGDGEPDLIPNPLFWKVPRDPSLVHLVGILGVPWQDVQARANAPGEPELHYQSARQLEESSGWTTILPSRRADGGLARPPGDALMVESAAPRVGFDGEAPPQPLAPPGAGFLANGVNGHERRITGSSDLQYACIFRLPEPRDCAVIGQGPDPRPSCDCVKPADDMNPLCQDLSGAFTTQQGYAKAYPSVRQLEVLRGLGDNAVVASLCARNLIATNEQDYGYRPAFDGVAERLKSSPTGTCVPNSIRSVPDPEDPSKTIAPCAVIEARPLGGEAPTCNPDRGLVALSPAEVTLTRTRLKAEAVCDVGGKPPCSALSLCRLLESAARCHVGRNATTPPGWCFIDPEDDPLVDPNLVNYCPATMRHAVLLDNVAPARDVTLLVSCSAPE